MAMGMTAADLYGTRPSSPATAVATPTQRPGEPEPTVAKPAPSEMGLKGNPTFWLVAMVGLAILLVQVSVRGSFEIGA